MAKRIIETKRFKQKMIRNKVRQEMLWLKKAHFTLSQIGRIYKVSRQRVYQIIK